MLFGQTISGNPSLFRFSGDGSVCLSQMIPVSADNQFCKTSHCPSSEDLLRFRRGRLRGKERARIKVHLTSCDFCSAELQLLMRHRTDPEEYRLTEMPAQIRRLAEDFLTGSAGPFTIIAFSNNRHSH